MSNQIVGRAKAIRLKCLECSNLNAAEVRKCPVTGCSLYPFRMGRIPKNYGKSDVFSDNCKDECNFTEED